jgi:hypothetical protein
LYGIRYHIITCISVFLALGLGLLLGGTLGDKVIVKEQVQLLDRLEDRYTAVKAENAKLSQQSADSEQKREQLKQVVAQVSDHYVRERLAGKKVAILALEPIDLAAVMTTLEKAGANVTNTTLVTNSHLLLDLHALPELNEMLGVSDTAGQSVRQTKLAERLVANLFANGEDKLVGYLQENNAMTSSGVLGSRPDHVVLVGGAGERSRTRLYQFDVPLVKALQAQELTVTGAEQADIRYSGVKYFREFGVSTVDNIDQTTGLVALIDVLSGAKGHYGVKKTAEALLPKLAAAKEVSSP